MAARKAEHPRSTHCIGGLYEAGDPTDQVTPNTQSATYQYADGTELHCDLRNWFSGPPEAQGIYIFGSQGLDEVWRRQCASVLRTEERAWSHVCCRRKADDVAAQSPLRKLHRLRALAQVREPQGAPRRGPFLDDALPPWQHFVSGGPFGELRRRSRTVRATTTRPTSFSVARIARRTCSRKT